MHINLNLKKKILSNFKKINFNFLFIYLFIYLFFLRLIHFLTLNPFVLHIHWSISLTSPRTFFFLGLKFFPYSTWDIYTPTT